MNADELVSDEMWAIVEPLSPSGLTKRRGGLGYSLGLPWPGSSTC